MKSIWLIRNYRPKNIQTFLRNVLRGLELGNRPLSEYNHEFDELMNQITEMWEVDKTGAYIEGLCLKSKVAVETNK